MTSYELTHFWKTKPQIRSTDRFLQAKSITFIFIKMMSLDLLVQMAYCLFGFSSRKVSRRCGLLYVSGKVPTYPPPKATLTLTSHLGQNVGLGEGRWAVSQKRIMVRSCSLFRRTTEKIFSHFKFFVLVFFQNATADFITNCDGLLLQSAIGITKCDRYYKV